jgi:ribosomal protein S18 acetylase RimI-like enzyme
MDLRPASLDDSAALAAFARDAFDAAFGHLYAPEDLAAFFADYRSEAKYATQIADPSIKIMLAEEGGEILAYALVAMDESFMERPEPRPERPLFLSQLYCAAGQTGRGLGAQLMQWVLDEARRQDADAIQLSVFSENFGAQKFYARCGFIHVADIDFWVGSHRDNEFLYELKLA